MGYYRSKPSKETQRTKWNQAMVDERDRLGLSSVNLDWQTADYFRMVEGLSPAAAAPRIKVKS